MDPWISATERSKVNTMNTMTMISPLPQQFYVIFDAQIPISDDQRLKHAEVATDVTEVHAGTAA